MIRLLTLLSLVGLGTACGAPTAPLPDAPAPPASADEPVPAVVIATSEPPPETAPEEPPDPAGVITVRSVSQLLSAIGPDRTIEMKPGVYDLGKATQASSGPVSWASVYDGNELVISGVKNLTIRAASDERPKILARPRYAWVMRFVDVADVALERLIVGHTDEGYCTGGVVAFENAENVRIADSELYGSGTVGLELKSVRGFRFERSVIRDCTYSIANLERATDALFADSQFIGNREFDLVELVGSPKVQFQRCTFERNHTNKGGGYVFFKTDARSSLVIEATKFKNNRFDRLTNAPQRMKAVDAPGSAGWAKQQLSKPDPQFNQNYAIARYKRWIVTGTQAGIVFWNPSTGKVDKLVKSFISSDLMVRGRYLWAGTYKSVMRFDGLKMKPYLQSSQTRGGSLVTGPGGKLLVKQRKLNTLPNHWWEYQPNQDRFAALPTASPRHVPTMLGGGSYAIFHDAVVRKNGEVWVLDFLRSLTRTVSGNATTIPIKSATYPGRDPRRFYLDPRGKLWVIDFGSGFFRYDDRKKAFIHEPGVMNKGSEMAIDTRRNRTWLLHYTDGLYLKDSRGAVTFIDLKRLQYMRALHLDKDGSVWVGGWNALVHIFQKGGRSWKQRNYVVDGSTVSAGAGP